MQCDICQRPQSTRLPFNCTSCARNELYGPRIQQAQVLLEAESIGQDVEKCVGSLGQSKVMSRNDAISLEGHPAFAIERATADRLNLTEQTEKIMTRVKLVRDQTEELKRLLAKKRSENSLRRSNLEDAQKLMAQRQGSGLGPVQENIKQTKGRWDALHVKTVDARTFLCREAAQLYGLQQRKRRKGARGRDLYYVGSLPTADLRDLNSKTHKISTLLSSHRYSDAPPLQVSASTANLAHLVHLVSHYLSLRLPAEITLPHRDYPRPTIFAPGSSYNAREIPYPGFTPTHSSNNSPSASRTADARSTPRPRPLHIERSLAVLAKEEPLVYASFVEGITLLAWDIAWICRSQGLDVGKSSWEDVCAMGRNLWQLLFGPHLATRKQPPPASDKPDANGSIEPRGGNQKPSLATLGQFSHGTAHSFLSDSEGLEIMSGWRLQNPYKVIDRVKTMLQIERDGAEWQLLEENEWEQPEAQVEPAGHEEAEVMNEAHTASIKGSRPGFEREPFEVDITGRGESTGDGKIKGASGWTKLKSRGAQ